MVFSTQFNGTAADDRTAEETVNLKSSMFHRTNKPFSSRADTYSVAHADSSSVKSNRAALAAKHRFRNQYHQQNKQQQHLNHNNDTENDGDNQNAERIAHAVGFKHPLDLCPKCSIPLLQQDLATIKEGRKRVVLCHSSSSTTTARTLGNDADTVGASMETYTHHEFDIAPLHPTGERNQENRRTPSFRSIGSNCGLMLPVLSVLEQFAGTYCDSICADQVTTSRYKARFEQGNTNNQLGVRQVPPYCPRCKAYVVQETGNKSLQDEMLTNLASWLASSSSSSSSYEDGESDDGGKVSKVSFRPSHGSITIMLNNQDNQQQLPRSINAVSSAEMSPRSLKIHSLHSKSPPRSPNFDSSNIVGEPMEWDTLMQRRTPRVGIVPRHSFPSSPGVQERYTVDDEELQEKKSLSSSSSIGRSSRRRRQYLDMLDDPLKQEVIVPHLQVPRTTPHVDPRRLMVQPEAVVHPEHGHQSDEACEVSPQNYSPQQWYDVGHRRGTDERKKILSSPTVPMLSVNQSEKPEMRGDVSSKEMQASEVHLPPRANMTTTQPKLEEGPRNQELQQTVVDDDNVSVGSCYTLKEETSIIGDYEKKREIATKAIGRKLMEGYVLTQTQCDHCQMPLMESSGISECVVCPLVSKKAKKRADRRRKGKAIVDTFDSESPPKRKQEKNLMDAPQSEVEPRDVEGESKGPFEEMKEKAEAQQEIDGLLIKWDVEAYEQEQQNDSPRSDEGSRAAGGEMFDTIENTLSREEVCDGDVSDCSGSDVYDIEIGNQEVYRRLLSGWLLTNSNCPQCLAPLMQSAAGDIECVVCNNTDSEVSSPRHSLSSDKLAGSKLLTSRECVNEMISENGEKVIDEAAPPRSISQGTPLIHSDGRGLRYLAIPDSLDVDDREALLLFLADSRRQLNEHQAGASSLEMQELGRGKVLTSETVRVEQGRGASPQASETSSSYGPRGTNDDGVGLLLPNAATPFPGERASSTGAYSHTQHLTQGNLGITRKPSTNSYTSDFTSSLDSRYTNVLKRDKAVSAPRTATGANAHERYRDDRHFRDVDVSSDASSRMAVSLVALDLLPRELRPGQIGHSKGEFAVVESYASSSTDITHDNFSDSRGQDFTLLSRNGTAPAPRTSISYTHTQPFARYSSSSRDLVAREESPQSETGAIFDFQDDDDLILRFDAQPSYASNPVVRRSISPSRTHQQSLKVDPRFRLYNEQGASPDFVVHHAILAENSTIRSRCPACSNALRPDTTSQGGACVNPHCNVYMIPVENIDIFTSAMKETGDSCALVERSAPEDRSERNISSSHSRGASWGSDRSRQLRDFDRQGWPSKRGRSALLKDAVESRDSSVDSVHTISSNAADVLLPRMNEARHKQATVGISSKKRPEEKSEMAVLIDRLASAAVAIKDLEQSVQEAEENSPQRSLNGRPPTSPKTKSPFLGNDRNIRWF